MSKDEYLEEKRLIEDAISEAQGDIERIEKELSHVPSEDDLVQLEEMAGTIVEALGDNLEIPDPEKRRIMELLNIKVLFSPDGKIKLTGFFCPPFLDMAFSFSERWIDEYDCRTCFLRIQPPPQNCPIVHRTDHAVCEISQ